MSLQVTDPVLLVRLSAGLMTSDRGSSGGAELTDLNQPVRVYCRRTQHSELVRWVVGSILRGGPIEILLVPRSET